MEQSDPSFNLIVLSDLAPAGGSPRALKVDAVDKDSIDEFLRKVGPTVEVDAGGARSVFTIQEFKDFRPERLVARVPAISNLLEFRKQVLALASGSGALDAVRASLQKLGAYPQLARALEASLLPPAPKEAPTPAPKPAPVAPPSGNLFEMVDAEGTAAPEAVSPEQAERAAAKLIGAVLGSSGSGDKPTPAALRKVAAEADAAVAPLLRAVLHHPRFQQLESSWRGLRFLVRSVDFRAGCRLHVVAAPRKDLLKAARDAALPLADDLRSQGKTCVLLLDYLFDGAEDDLGALAEDASARSLPLLASAGLEIAVRDLAARLDDPSQAEWTALRSSPASRWLALAVNRFLLRPLYGAESDPVRDLAFEESAGAETPLAWGRPGWLLAALVASSFARTGWATDFSGREGNPAIEALPLRPGEAETTPLEADLTEAAANALGDAGLLPFACRRGHDRPFAAGSSALHRAGKGEPGATLRFALFAAPIAATMESILGHLDPTRSIEEIAKTIGAALTLMGMSPSGAVYTAQAAPAADGRPAVAVRVRPQGGPLRGLTDLAFEVPIALH